MSAANNEPQGLQQKQAGDGEEGGPSANHFIMSGQAMMRAFGLEKPKRF
jgi:hypothetical protein